jgi:thiol-disulfide isomerase/thioredoxin
MEHVIELFVAHHCPSCPDARQRVREFADAYPNVNVTERSVDDAMDVAVAVGYGLFATPAIVVDGCAVLYGVPTLAQLIARCKATESVNREGVPEGRPQPGRQSDTGLTTGP